VKSIRSKAIRESARGEMCQVRIPGHCNGNPETTVFAHLNGGGMGTKKSDLHGAYCCSGCHDALDGRVRSMWSAKERRLWHYEGVERTQDILVEKSLLVLMP